jgi:hypothetical protein
MSLINLFKGSHIARGCGLRQIEILGLRVGNYLCRRRAAKNAAIATNNREV